MQHRKAVRHLLTVESLRPEEIREIFTIAHELKARWSRGENTPLLAGRVMALLFEKPSLRTRVSFQAAMAHLGGTSLYLGAETGFGKREQMADFVRVLCRYVDVIVLRAYDHSMVEQFASYATASVINGLTDYSHPCQAASRSVHNRRTLWHAGRTKSGLRRRREQRGSQSGDGLREVRRAVRNGYSPGYRFPAAYVRRLIAGGMSGGLTVTEDPAEAVRDATVVYTDVWTSMGQEAEAEQRRRDFAAFQSQRNLDGSGCSQCHLHALYACSPRGGGHRRRYGRPTKRCAGAGRQPPPCSERHPGLDT